jgi:hypothetical protein
VNQNPNNSENDSVCHGAYKFIVGLATIQRPLHIAAEAQGIDVVQQVTAAIEAVQLPHWFLCAVLARVGAELADNHTLARDLRGEGGEDVLDVVLLGENQLRVYLAARLHNFRFVRCPPWYRVNTMQVLVHRLSRNSESQLSVFDPTDPTYWNLTASPPGSNSTRSVRFVG